MAKEKPQQVPVVSFENSLKELEKLFLALSLARYHLKMRSMNLNVASKSLNKDRKFYNRAEQRVQILLSDDENKALDDFSPDTE